MDKTKKQKATRTASNARALLQLRREVDEMRAALDVKREVEVGVREAKATVPALAQPGLGIEMLAAVVINQCALSSRKGSREKRVLQQASSMLAAQAVFGILESMALFFPQEPTESADFGPGDDLR